MPDGGCCRGSRGRFDLPELDTALIIACRIRSAVALHFAPCRVHRTLRVTPAMQARAGGSRLDDCRANSGGLEGGVPNARLQRQRV